ncbi:MAG: putative porin, partial [Candidatus Tectomicrobia bacterium]|nr:putative porin [Candidatus Tectomicrobia bacterium]
MRLFVAVVVVVLMIFLQIGPGWAQSDADRIRQMEQDLAKIRQDLEALKKEPAKLPLKFGLSVTFRIDQSEIEDEQDLLLEDNEIEALRARIRFSVEYIDPQSRVTGGIRLSTGEDPNPTSPFITLGNSFRSRSFNIDQYYLTYKPLKFYEQFKVFEDVALTFGKIPMPFWRGDRGTWRSELVWDDDINPEGALLRIPITFPDLPSVQIENVFGYFAVNWLGDVRFEGLTRDTYLIADQFKIKVDPVPTAGVTVAFAVYNYQNLNAGLRAPNFRPDLG